MAQGQYMYLGGTPGSDDAGQGQNQVPSGPSTPATPDPEGIGAPITEPDDGTTEAQEDETDSETEETIA